MKISLLHILLFSILLLLIDFNCYGQLKGSHLLGDYGLEAATQAPPSIAIVLPVYWYDANKVMDNSGKALDPSPDTSIFLLGLGGNLVTKFKILGANYGASLLLCMTSSKLEGNQIDSESSFAFSDSYIQPLQLGWHLKQADFTFGYGLYIPTGTYENGGDNNSGEGMWTHEFSAGTTLYFDKEKSFNFSVLVFYELHSKKKDSDTRVGQIMTLEGGVGKTFYPKVTKEHLSMPVSIGAVYYAQFKLTDDSIDINDNVFSGSRDHIYALGAEVNVLYPQTNTALSFRWLGELGASNRSQGNTFLITVSQFLKMF